MTISSALAAQVKERALHRCGYCLAAQYYVLGWLEIEHIVPKSRGGKDTEENLWLACRMCNTYKSDQVSGVDPETRTVATLFNPCSQLWKDHFRWSEDGAEIIGTTETGRATVAALQLNNELALIVRRNWVNVGWHPPKD